MNAWLFFALVVAGGVGATCRFAIDAAVRPRLASTVPWSTISINLSGSLALGVLTGFASAALLPGWALAIAGAGFLGGYTTFSTASVETVRLLQQRRRGAGAFVALGTLLGASLLAGLGLWIGMLL